jgi:proteasome lid subunit RPN8/RPN11
MADASPCESPIDVRLLGTRELPRAEFPGGADQVFRVYFAPEVHDALWKHAVADTSVEICGVLVGAWERDARGPFVRVTASIRGEAADNKFAEVTFTHDTWAKINARMDNEFSHLAIVGWYHTHPDFGIFLSDRDRFIHEHFFSGVGQVAHVIDPVRRDEGVFVWKDGTPARTDHFWVGDRLVHAGAGEGRAEAPSPGQGPAAPPAAAAAGRGMRLTQLLAYVALFLLGYTLAGFRSAWEDRMLSEGAVYHFGVWKGLRVGLREELDELGRELTLIGQAVRDQDGREKPSEKARGRPTTDEILAGVRTVGKHVEAIKHAYGYTDTEQETVRYLLNRAAGLVRQGEPTPAEPRDKAPGDDARKPAPQAARPSK